MLKLPILVVFLFYVIFTKAQTKHHYVSLETQNKMMETIFKNISLELICQDFKNFTPETLTIENYVEKYTKQMNLELNKLLNQIFVINVKNYVRNYTNELREMLLDGLEKNDKIKISNDKIVNLSDVENLNDNLYSLISQLKGKRFLNKTKSNVNLNETEQYVIGNEIIKGILKYYLIQKHPIGNFTNKVINSFDFSKAIDMKWSLIEQEIDSSLNYIRLHRFIHNSDINENIEYVIFFNITLNIIESEIRNVEILNDFLKILKNNPNENNNEFQRKFNIFLIIYSIVLILIVLITGGFVIFKCFSQKIRPKKYEIF